jgi:general secretion pathway protein D
MSIDDNRFDRSTEDTTEDSQKRKVEVESAPQHKSSQQSNNRIKGSTSNNDVDLNIHAANERGINLREVKVNMNKHSIIHRVLAILLTICLVMPGVALAAKSGKKNFKEGVKYEQLQQWDMAAQQYALACQAEPNNPEYRLRYLRALQQASIMYIKRGDALSEQSDFAGAYTAYKTAFSYDQTNEIARQKMERMLEQQKLQTEGAQPLKIRNGNVRLTSDDIQLQNKSRSRDVVTSITFKQTKFKNVVTNLTRPLGLNVVFDETVKDFPIDVDLQEVTMAKALDIILKTYKYSFEQVDRRTILIYLDNPSNRPKFETLRVKPFYLKNINAQQAKTALTGMLPSGRPITSLDTGNQGGGNMLIVKATTEELQLIQDILGAIDKNKNEVVLDLEIYEVGHDSVTQIGNQITPTTLTNFGGVSGYLTGTGNQSLASNLIGTSGALIGLPLTSLALLQSKGNSKLLYRTQIHVLDGQKNQIKVGQQVPVRLGQTYPGGFLGGGIPGQQQGVGGAVNQVASSLLGGGFNQFGAIDNIQYRDVGLVIDAKPQITSEGYVELEMKFSTSDQVQSGSDTINLTPTFTQRELSTTARMQDGVTAVVAGINQEVKGDSRAGVPVVGLLPVLGRLFTAPRQQSRQVDIVITVTPHIVRSQGIDEKDHLALDAGQQLSGPNPTIEAVVYRAQQEEEGERRLIAQQQQAPPSAPGDGPPTVTATSFNRTESQTTIQPVGNANPRQPIYPSVPSPQARTQTGLVEAQPPAGESVSVTTASKSNSANNDAQLYMRLLPNPIRPQLGRSFFVAVDVSGKALMTGAEVAIKFDDKTVQFKSVRDGGVLGERPDYAVEKGNLIVSLKQSKPTPVSANGRLLLIEFKAIAEGQSEIAFVDSATWLRLPGNGSAQANGSATQVIISNPGSLTSNANDEK